MDIYFQFAVTTSSKSAIEAATKCYIETVKPKVFDDTNALRQLHELEKLKALDLYRRENKLGHRRPEIFAEYEGKLGEVR